MRKTLLLLGGCFLFGWGMCAEVPVKSLSAESSFTIPCEVAGVRSSSFSLNGDWQFRYSPKGGWNTVRVPGELAMQGYAVNHDTPYLYRKTFMLPADYKDKHVILRFDGVYSHARLSVNGKQVREHHGGFTRWETDVTEFVHAGKKNEIQLEVTDRLDEISYASGYAHHPIGGILRDVTIFALPQSCFYDFSAETQLDADYRDAVLKIAYAGKTAGEAEMAYVLTDPSGKQVPLTQSVFTMKEHENVNELPISAPMKWDAEHPNLYTLSITLREGGETIGRFTKKIGFREVKIVKDRMLVNGQPVKLRGACRHDIHPTLGRTTTVELDSLDAVLFKQSNMNFVRTSHYPPSEHFLEFCDRYGIYVESETAVCFVDTYRQKNYAPGKTQDDSSYTDRYVGQCREMVKSFRNHPSILFWSIGNESAYGKNFQASWDWVKAADTTRPVIFSYPGSVGERKPIFDLLSMHYQDVYGNLDQWGMSTRNFQGHGIPVLYDEWAHPACYTYATLQNDPNIREFWGKSIDMMWSGLFEARGGLGGAIWGYIDETFALPEPKKGTAYWKEFARTAKPAEYQGNCVGYGEWGIVDVWRRKKPEFWSTKKAYSPIRLSAENNLSYIQGQRLTMTIYNRFDHTNLNEIRATYTYKGISKPVQLNSLLPHRKGILTIPAEQWEEGESLLIEFFTTDGELIDAYRPVLGKEKIDYPAVLPGKELTVTETESLLTIIGEGFEIPFDKATGLICNAKAGEEIIIEKGPFLNLYVNLNHLTGAEVRKVADRFVTSDADWKKTSFNYRQQAGNVYVALSGTYRNVYVDFSIRIAPSGELSIDYQTQGLPNGYLRETGLSFYLSEAIRQLDWKRKGYWNYYPEGEFAGNEGSVSLYRSEQAAYGQKPVQPWHNDTHNYYYWADKGANCDQPLTQTAKGMKENVYYYSLSTGSNRRLSVVSDDASVACRMNKRADGQLVLYTDNRWDYPEIAWGNYCKTLEALPCYGQINLRMK